MNLRDDRVVRVPLAKLRAIPDTPGLPNPKLLPDTPVVEEPQPEPLDIEIGRLALRTFRTAKGTLDSIVRGYTWEGGVAIAECLRSDSSPPCKSPPGEACTCGVYGTLTIDQLYREYASYAAKCIAVIAAEGETIIGDRGLRTAAARIVAYWASDGFDGWRYTEADARDVFAKQCPDAIRFSTVEEMLEAYHFPKELPRNVDWAWKRLGNP